MLRPPPSYSNECRFGCAVGRPVHLKCSHCLRASRGTYDGVAVLKSSCRREVPDVKGQFGLRRHRGHNQ